MRIRFVFAALASCYVALGEQPECTAEDKGQYYDLRPLRSKSFYYFKSATGREFWLNACAAVDMEKWELPDSSTVGALYRGSSSDVSIGIVNSTLRIEGSNPLLVLSGGSPCGGEGSNIRAATAIRFICDNNVFNAGQPQLIAQLPPDDDSACAFFFEWRTHVACPTAKPGGIGSVIAILAAAALIIFLSYIVAGVLYRRFALGYRGFDQLPQMSIISLSAIPHSFADVLDWFRDIRDHLRGGARDLWPRSNANGGSRASNWPRRRDGFSPLAREEEEAMFRDGPDGPDARFSLEDETDLSGAQELVDSTPPVPAKDADDSEGPVRL